MSTTVQQPPDIGAARQHSVRIERYSVTGNPAATRAVVERLNGKIVTVGHNNSLLSEEELDREARQLARQFDAVLLPAEPELPADEPAAALPSGPAPRLSRDMIRLIEAVIVRDGIVQIYPGLWGEPTKVYLHIRHSSYSTFWSGADLIRIERDKELAGISYDELLAEVSRG